MKTTRLVLNWHNLVLNDSQRKPLAFV